MHAVIRPAARAAALFLVAPFLTLSSALAPQHIHEPGPGHDHDHAVAHSHFSLHDVDADHSSDLEIEHDLEHVVWLDSAILHESPYQADAVPPAVPVSCALVGSELRWSVTPFDDAAPVHGPPKRLELLRGPPAFLV